MLRRNELVSIVKEVLVGQDDDGHHPTYEELAQRIVETLLSHLQGPKYDNQSRD